MDGQGKPGNATGRDRSAPGLLRVRREQLSVKITEEACDRFRRLAGEHRLTLGELFEQALDAWEAERLEPCRARPCGRSLAMHQPLRVTSDTYQASPRTARMRAISAGAV